MHNLMPFLSFSTQRQIDTEPSRMHIGPYGSKLSQKVANREMNRSSLLLREKSESDVS